MSKSTGIEPATQAFLDKVNSNTGPQIYELPPAEGRKLFIELQKSVPVELPEVDLEDIIVPAGSFGEVPVRIARPRGVKTALPALVYVHGAGWVFGGWETHERLIRELVTKSQIAVAFVEFSLSPEAPSPMALEQSYAVAKYVADNSKFLNFDPSRLAVGGDSVGGNMATAVTMLAKQRSGPRIDFQLLFYPVTDASFDTGSYKQFAQKHFLSLEAMKWFWNQYEPDTKKRTQPTLSPLRATTEDLKGLPPALVITAEFDVLRDEGEAYAHKLSEAGVKVSALRCLGTIHDFVLLNAITHTPAPRMAIDLAAHHLRQHLVPALASATV
jgi:acetyl esterase